MCYISYLSQQHSCRFFVYLFYYVLYGKRDWTEFINQLAETCMLLFIRLAKVVFI